MHLEEALKVRLEESFPAPLLLQLVVFIMRERRVMVMIIIIIMRNKVHLRRSDGRKL